MTRLRLGLGAVVVAAILGAGCYFNPNAPVRYYNAPKVELAEQPGQMPGAPKRLVKARRALVMPLWSSYVTNPVGGLYDHTGGGIVPLRATFFHPNVAMPIWEASARRLRAYGVRTYKDYGDVGTTTLQAELLRGAAVAAATKVRGDATAPPSRVWVLRGRLLSLAHNQARSGWSKPERYEAAQAALELDLLAPSGRELWRKRLTVYAKKAASDRRDLLEALGAEIVDALLRDPKARRLLGSETPPAPTSPRRKTTPRVVPGPARTLRVALSTRPRAAPAKPRRRQAPMPTDDASQLLDTLGDPR